VRWGVLEVLCTGGVVTVYAPLAQFEFRVIDWCFLEVVRLSASPVFRFSQFSKKKRVSWKKTDEANKGHMLAYWLDSGSLVNSG